jgi:hypothetical protein
MNKSQFIVIGVLSLIAAVGTTSTISAYAAISGGDVLSTLDKTVKSLPLSDLEQKAQPDFSSSSLKDFADKSTTANTPDVGSLLGSANSTSATLGQ